MSDARRGFRHALAMDLAVFWIGLFLIVVSAVLALLVQGDLAVWSGAGGAAGGVGVLGVLYGAFVAKPRNGVTSAVDHLMSLKVVFLAYLRELFQSDQAYARCVIEGTTASVEELDRFALRIEKGMAAAVQSIARLRPSSRSCEGLPTGRWLSFASSPMRSGGNRRGAPARARASGTAARHGERPPNAVTDTCVAGAPSNGEPLSVLWSHRGDIEYSPFAMPHRVATAPAAPLRDAKTWKLRLGKLVQHATECPVVFIVGSGLSWSKGSGVWDVPTMIHHGRTLLLKERGEDPERADRSGLPQNYQSLMDELGAIDSELPNVLVRQGVLAACTAPEATDVARLRREPQRQACLRLQERTDAWRLPRGVLGLARLIRLIEDVRSTQAPGLRPPAIITTNFDGLIEIALRREAVPFESQATILDAQLRSVTHAVTLWHVHGSWLGETTLHTQQELQAEASQIQESLKRRFDGARVVALGYGAWADVVFASVGEVFHGSFERAPELTWSFYELDADTVRTTYEHVFRAFEGRLTGKVCFATGVDVHAELPEVAGLNELAGSDGGRGAGAGRGTPDLSRPFPPSWACASGTDGLSPYPFADLQLAPGITTRLRWIPPGSFMMGSPESETG